MITTKLRTNEQQFLASLEILNEEFYTRADVVKIETEAYEGVVDKASHAYNNRRTKRTEIMYAGGGAAYVYLCYGIHHLFNVVTNNKNIPHAILVRAIKPIEGIETILKRRNLARSR